jgi:hypothetical protein
MAFTPINPQAFAASYAGAVSGMAISGWISDPVATDYALVTSVAGAFAQAFDGVWNSATPLNTLEQQSIVSACAAEFAGRGPGPTNNPSFQTPSFWNVPAKACAALVLEGDAYFASIGVTPPPLPTGGGSGQLIFPNIAAMSAFNVTSPTVLVNPGQQAFVQSNGSVWTLRTDGTIASDGITVVTAAPGEPRKWMRENIGGYFPSVLQQSQWHIDPQNVSGTASDENDGKTAATALRTKAEVFRRWGYTWSPELDTVNVTITYHSADNNADDPGAFAPKFKNGATLRQTAIAPAPAFTGTLNVVQAKNPAANLQLAASFNTMSGAVVKDMLLTNLTRGNSVAIVNTFAAGTATLDQPLAPQTLGNFPTLTSVDTWAAGDVIQGILPLNIDQAVIGGDVSSFNASFPPAHWVDTMNIADLSGGNTGSLQVDLNATPMLLNCVVSKGGMSIHGGTAGFQGFFIGNAFTGLVFGESNSFFSYQFSGGHFEQAVTLTSGGVLTNNPSILASLILENGRATGQVFGSAAGSLVTRGLSIVVGPVFGGLLVNAAQGFISYSFPAATAFPAAGGLKINSQGIAYSNVTAGGSGSGGVVTTHGLALTAAALDAAAGAAGFGGLAYVPGVGGFTTGVAP